MIGFAPDGWPPTQSLSASLLFHPLSSQRSSNGGRSSSKSPAHFPALYLAPSRLFSSQPPSLRRRRSCSKRKDGNFANQLHEVNIVGKKIFKNHVSIVGLFPFFFPLVWSQNNNNFRSNFLRSIGLSVRIWFETIKLRWLSYWKNTNYSAFPPLPHFW